jgi:hypothetical protein
MFSFLADPATVSTIALASLGAAGTVGVWALRVEGRVNVHESLLVEREKQAQERHNEVKEDLAELKSMIKAIKR